MAFTNASNFAMGDVQFNYTTENRTDIKQSAVFDSDPLRMLLDHSATIAMSDSPTVYEPTCHPGTREVVADRIMAWARDRQGTPILWLSGPAGAGKSCIQRTIVQTCTAEGLLVASFFFSIKHPEASNETRFIATLAAQFAETIRGFKGNIERAITMDRRMFTKALELQLEGLIFKPLQEWDDAISNRLARLFWRTLMALVAHQEDSDTPWTRNNIIVIDGLDECIDEREQVHILRLVHTLAKHPRFPFRFAIASRPEYAIRTAFCSSPFSNDTLILRLEDYEADEDLRRYSNAEFARLKSDHPAAESIPVSWPSTKDKDTLIAKASQQFVYVSVVMKHLTNPRRHPVLELQKILGHRPFENDAKSNPFAELDALYDRIMHPPDVDASLLKTILHSIIHDKPGSHSLHGPESITESPSPVDDFDILFSLEPGTTMATLVDLHSVLNISSPSKRPTFHHKSLEDFLTSHSRAGDLYQSNDQTHLQLTLAYHELGQRLENTATDHELRQRLDEGGAAKGRHLWNLCLITKSHACSVDNWLLFEREFSKNILPASIETHTRIQIKTETGELQLKFKGNADLDISHPKDIFDDAMAVIKQRSRRLAPYSHRYHSFFCSSEDGCLRQCTRLSSLVNIDPLAEVKRLGGMYDRLAVMYKPKFQRGSVLYPALLPPLNVSEPRCRKVRPPRNFCKLYWAQTFAPSGYH
ncbi:hypothetical protein MD484_g462, partial [Candolleomyces efflorescens]